MHFSSSCILSARRARPLFLATLASLAAFGIPLRAGAQDVIDARAAAEIHKRYLNDLDTLHTKIMALANAIPEDKYGWRPAAGVRSIAEALMHIASEWYFFTPQSVAMGPPADFGSPRETLPRLEKITAKAEVIDQLDRSWAHCQQQLKAADPSKLTGVYKPWNTTFAEAAFVMAGDLHEHLGQMIAYARSVGVKPPWSK